MSQITLIKTFNGHFKLAYDSDYEKSKKIPLNEPIIYEWKKVRNYEFHKKFFSLVNMVYQNQEQYNNIDDLRDDLTVKAGFYYKYINIDEIEVKKPKSISFASMDENEFSNLYNAFIDVVVNWLSIEKQDVLDNIAQFY